MSELRKAAIALVNTPSVPNTNFVVPTDTIRELEIAATIKGMRWAFERAAKEVDDVTVGVRWSVSAAPTPWKVTSGQFERKTGDLIRKLAREGDE